jgi:molybdenum cofactor cytidylyltransferase
MDSSKCNAIILAAGQSQRFGKPKFSLPFDAEKTFLEKIINEYVSVGCNKIVVVINPESKPYFQKAFWMQSDHFEIVINPNPEIGRFSSVKTGLAALAEPQPTFIQNVDNPFVTDELLQLLLGSLKKHDGVCPAFQKKGGHPLLISASLVTNLKSAEYGLDFKQYLKEFDIQKPEVTDSKVLANINAAEEYKKWFNTI